MFHRSHGNATVEFALALPVLLALFIPVVQLLRLSLLQARLEVTAFQVARRLAAEAAPGADLAALAATFTAGVRPAVMCRARSRALVDVPAAFPRRARHAEVIEVDLLAAGPRLVPGVPLEVTAHGREFRIEAINTPPVLPRNGAKPFQFATQTNSCSVATSVNRRRSRACEAASAAFKRSISAAC